MKENALSKKLRAAPAEKAVTPNSDSVHEEIASLATHTDEGKATIAGIYLQLWQVIRDARKLHQSTAKHYDRTIVRMVLPYFNDKAFEDMTEDDFLNRWDILLKSDIKPYAVQTAATVIRALVEEANKVGLTQTTLWGIPQFSDSDYLATFLGYEEKTYEEFAEKEANRLANIGVRIPRSIPLDKEIELFKWLVDNWREHGELIAGLIMLCTGARTSEATGFSYRYFCEVSPGY